jgi:hypothetical protein
MSAQPDGLNAEQLREQLQHLASEAGVRQWDLGAGCSTDTSVQVDRGEAKQMKGAQRSSITVRVWNEDGLVGITSTSDLSPTGLATALHGAREASNFGNPDDTPAFSPLATAPLAPLDQPAMRRAAFWSCSTPSNRPKPICWDATRRSAPFPTTAWPSAAAKGSTSTVTEPAGTRA